MRTQKFVAPTMREAMTKVREALGEDALIIKSERIRSAGSFNLAKQDLIQVTAMKSSDSQTNDMAGPEFAETLEKSMSDNSTPPSIHELATLRDEIRALQSELTEMGRQIRNSRLPSLPPELTRVWQRLEESGVSMDWATDVVQQALVQLTAESLESPTQVSNYVYEQLSRVIRPAPLTGVPRKGVYKIALVGAPGAGKTTLLQKLTSDPLAYGKRKVGLISLDTHRMAAIEQIRSFARIAGTPLEIAYRSDQIAGLQQRLSGCEVVLIDTAGCSAYDQSRLDELRSFLDEINPDEIHLVLNASVRDEDQVYACQRYRDLNVTHLDFTRLDESLRHGFLLNVVRAAAKPVAWLSNGQGFLNCLERFTTETLRQWTMNARREDRQPSRQSQPAYR